MLECDELYVVSDLHLGGEASRQIFDQGVELAALIDYAANRAMTKRVTFVVNGDIVDFLAKAPDANLQTVLAPKAFRAIKEDTAFAMIWEAMASFVAHSNARLVLVIGNHDVELALPAVRSALVEAVTGGNVHYAERVILALDGAGFDARVGGRRVRCIHGNEFDDWNFVDHKMVARIIADLERQATPAPWIPNAGARLVVDVMNDIKRSHPFIDLLKPEGRGLFAILLALDRSALAKLSDLAGVLGTFLRRKWPFLGADERPLETIRTAPFDRQIVNEERRVRAALEQLGDDVDARAWPSDLVGRYDQYLGAVGLAWNVATSGDPKKDLRESLAKWLGRDQTFAIDKQDDLFKSIDHDVDPSFDFVIAGHSHLERALPRARGDGFYFNSGTWVRLIQLTPSQLASDAAFDDVYAALSAPSLEALEHLVLRRNTVVCVIDTGDQVVAELRHVERRYGTITFGAVPGSTFKVGRML